jgi:glyoxylase-like metal-dependent hydrolase (beta-lactamase superfamily II)
MSRKFALPLMFAGLLALTGGSVATQQQFPPGYVDPKPILDAAIQAIGNDKLNCVTISGTAYDGAVGQQKESGKNVDWPRIDMLANYTRTMNWQAKTMKEEFDRKPGLTPAAWKYGIGWIDGPLQRQTHQIFMLNASGATPYAWHMDGPTGPPVRNELDVAEVFPVELWMNPHGFLKAAQMPGANPIATWRWELGEMGRDGPQTNPEKMNVVRITAPGGFKIDATINKEHMLQRMHTMVSDPVLGDLNYEHEFTNESYIDIGNGIKFPTGWHSHEGYDDNFQNQNISAGHNAFGGTMKDVKANVCPDAVAVPDAVRNTQFPTQPTMTKLADGVYSFEIGSYKSVAVEFPTTIAVFEAPRNEDFNLRVIEAIVKQIPNKPIRFVINSHQHFDAAGGLRTYYHIGATVITSWHNYDFYKHDFISYAARTIKPDMVSLWPPTELAEGYFYETVRENYTLEEAGRVMHVYYVNPLQHAEGMLMAYLPKEKLLIESDIVNTNNPLPAMPTRDLQKFYDEVKALKLDVAQIVPIHGKPIPWSDFAKLFATKQTASAAN